MNAIVVTDKQWAIGRSGDLLFSLPGDMKHFRTLTTGGTVIMGRKTLDSFPAADRCPSAEYVTPVSRPFREGCEIVHTPEDALRLAGDGRGRLAHRRRQHLCPLCWAGAAAPASPAWTPPLKTPIRFSQI